MADAQKETVSVVIDGKRYGWVEHISSAVVRVKKIHERISRGITLAGCVLAVGILARLVIEVLRVYEHNKYPSNGVILDSLYQGQVLSVFAPLEGVLALGSWFLLFACFCFFRKVSTKHVSKRMPMLNGSKLPQIEIRADRGSLTNIAEFYSQDANHTVEQAFELAHRYKHSWLSPLHLFVGSLGEKQAALMFGRLGLDFSGVKDPILHKLQQQQVGGKSDFSKEALTVLTHAFLEAVRRGRREVTSLEILNASFQADPFIRELFFDLKVDEQQVTNVVEWIRITEKLIERYHAYRKAAAFKPTGPMNRAMSSVATPVLDSISEDLTKSAVDGRLSLLIGREEEMEQLFRIIEGGRRSVVLVGPSGVGKSAVLEGVAERMVEERVPKIMRDKRLVSISIPHLLSGLSDAQAQERLLHALNDAVRAKNIILVFENIEQLTQGPAELLTEYLTHGATFAIATTTPQAYTKQVEQTVLGTSFEKVIVTEPDINSAIHTLESKIGSIEYEFKVFFSYAAVEKSVKLTDRYLHDEYLPKKAIEACREAALRVSKTRGPDASVGAEDIAEIVSEKSHVPLKSVGQDESADLLHLEDRLHARVIGQDEAVKSVAAALRRGRVGLRSEGRPIATFLFLGPTGVGKTELAKTVAAEFYGDTNAMQRFDMSEYQDKSSIHRLIGVPGGSEGGLLSEAVRHNPFSIVLLDEFEKANPEILNIFLQVFDDGRLTDATGRTIDFSNTVIVATSNAGAEYIQDAVVQNVPIIEMQKHLIEEELRGIYRPEMLNRFDAVIVFKPLSLEEVEQIAKLMIKQVQDQLEPKGIYLRVEPDALQELVRAGFDPKYGARPLRRAVQERVDDAIAKVFLEGRVGRRDTIVLKGGGVLEIEKAQEL